jgi:predicted DNA-binding transcriptional regulator AlpA
MEQKKVMLSVKEVQEKIGCCKEYSYRLMNSNQFPTIKIGRMRFVHEDILNSWLRGEYNKG